MRARRKLATAGMLLLVVMLGYHVVFGANGMVAYQHKRAENHKLQQDILRLRAGERPHLPEGPRTEERSPRHRARSPRTAQVRASRRGGLCRSRAAPAEFHGHCTDALSPLR